MQLVKLLAGTALALAGLCSQAQTYSALYVFGDSLSDSGNNARIIGPNGSQTITGNSYIPTQPYGSGTYSNANVWVTPFAAGLGLAAWSAPSLAGGGDYAYGGARTSVNGSIGGFPPSTATQLASYLGGSSGVASSSALYVIATGGNDVRDTLAAVSADPGNANTIITTAAASFAASLGGMVDSLQAAGAQHIIVWDAPNVGAAPAVRALGTTAITVASMAASAYNAALTARLNGEAGVSVFDVYGIFSALSTNPAAYGLSNATDACGAIAGCNPATYAFWDGIHPTSAGHALLASAMLATAVPEPASVLMLGAGVFVVVLRLRRRAQTPSSASADTSASRSASAL